MQPAAATSQLASIVCNWFRGMCLTESVFLCLQTRFYVRARLPWRKYEHTSEDEHLLFPLFFAHFVLCRLKKQGNNVGLDKSNY